MDTTMKKITPGNFCELEFTRRIQNYKVFSLPYHDHSTHHDSELGFYHVFMNAVLGEK